MKKWFKRTALGLIVPSLLLLGACGGGSDEGTGEAGGEPNAGSGDVKTINAGIGLAESNPQGQGLLKFKELVEEKSGGSIKVNTFFDASLGDDVKMTEALQAGTQEVTIPSTSPLMSIVPEFGAFDLPFVFNEETEVDQILDGKIGDQLKDMLPEHGLIGLSYWENGFRQMTISKHPIEKLEDFQGLKIRTMENQIHLDAFKELGANPTPMAFSEVFTALESKTIDGQENPIPTIYTQRFNEVQDYMSLTKHVYTPFIVLVSKKFWDGLSEEEQQILMESSVEAGQFQRDLARSENESAIQELEEAGMQVNVVSDEARAEMQEKLEGVINKHAESIGPIVDELFEELEAIRGN